MIQPVFIHPTAIVEAGAELGVSVRIGPYCHIGPNVRIGDATVLHSHIAIARQTSIGADCEIYPFASLGHAPQDLKFGGEDSHLNIGDRNRIREHVTMNPGTEGGGMETVVGHDNLFMVGVHIAHDCRIGSHVVMANNATLGGHVSVGDHAVIGGLAAVRQFIRIGAYAMIGGLSGVENDVIPYGLVKGERAFLDGLNIVGLTRSNVTKDGIRALQHAVDALFAEDGTMEVRLARLEQDYAADPLVMTIAHFAREKTKFPLCAPHRKRA